MAENITRDAAPENKLGTMPIGPLIASVSLPIVLSMLVQALYNIVDSIFVAQIGEEALTAVSLVFPIQNLMIAVAAGTAVGVNSLLSRRLGEKDYAAANSVAMNGIFLALLSWVAFAVLGLLTSSLFFSSYAGHTESGQAIAEMGTAYMQYVTVGSLGVFMGITFERLLQSTGRSVFSMFSQMTGAVINIILDPILIFGWFGFPAMGVVGAAVATIIGQILGMCLSLFLNLTRNKDLHLQFRGFRPNKRHIKQIYAVGLPSILMQSIGSVMVFGINQILIRFGTTPVSVFGIYFKLQSFVYMPVFGFNNGAVSIVAYNYGASRPDRIQKAIRISILIALSILAAGTLIFWIMPGPLLLLFDAKENMLRIGTHALRIISLAFPMAAISIVLTGVFQALGKAMYSFVMSVVRQLVFLLPLAWILSTWWGLDALWFAFPAAEVIALCMSIFFYSRVRKNTLQPLYAAAASRA